MLTFVNTLSQKSYKFVVLFKFYFLFNINSFNWSITSSSLWSSQLYSFWGCNDSSSGV